MLRILIAEDHALVRASIHALLAQTADFAVVGEADNGRDAVRAVSQTRPDVVLMDLSMPGMNGMEAIADIKRRFPATRVLVLTLHKAEEYICASLQAGADGYLLKEAVPDELHAAIRSVANGKVYLSQEVSGNSQVLIFARPAPQPPRGTSRPGARGKFLSSSPKEERASRLPNSST
jgi:DNA-binding NarL/FixJ family response regulator